MKKILLCPFALMMACMVVRGIESNDIIDNIETMMDDVYVTQAYGEDGSRLTVKVKDTGLDLEVIAIRTEFGWSSGTITYWTPEGYYFYYNGVIYWL